MVVQFCDVEEVAVGGILLHLVGDAVHHFDRFDRELADSAFAGEHDGVCAIEHGGGDVGDFGARRHGRLRHAFEHLRCDDDGLSGTAGLARDLLLQTRHALDRGISTPRSPRATMKPSPAAMMASRIVNCRGLLDLGEDSRAAFDDAFGFENVFCALYERERDPVGADLERIVEVGPILLGQGADLEQGVWKAHAFARREDARVQDLG